MDTDPLLPKPPPPPYVPTAWRSPLLPLCEWHYLDGTCIVLVMATYHRPIGFTSCCCPCLALADVAGHIDACGGFYTTLASAGLLVELILVLQVLASSSVVLRGLGLVALLGYLLFIASLRTSVRRALKIRGSRTRRRAHVGSLSLLHDRPNDLRGPPARPTDRSFDRISPGMRPTT